MSTKVIFSNILKNGETENSLMPAIVIVIDAREECFESLNDLKTAYPDQIYTMHADCLKAHEDGYLESIQDQVAQIQKQAYKKYGLDCQSHVIVHNSIGQTDPSDDKFVESVTGQSKIESTISPFISGDIFRMNVDNKSCPLTTKTLVSKLLSAKK